MKKKQRFSHYQGCWQLGRKDNLCHNLKKKQRIYPKYFDFLPKTYCLKYDYDEFIQDKKKRKYWILKPVASTRGKGIRVVSRDEKIKYNKSNFFKKIFQKIFLLKIILPAKLKFFLKQTFWLVNTLTILIS